jgi:hypothetical protein
VAVAALALTALAGCRSNVGAAATVNGHRISESDVAQYLTADAQPIAGTNQATGATVQTPPRSFVLSTLLDARLFDELLRATPHGAASAGDLAAAQAKVLNGAPVQQVSDGVARSGLTRSFATVYLRERSIEQLINDQVTAGVDVQALLNKMHVDVSVNPRYGTWDAKTFSVAATGRDGLPAFLSANATYTPPVASPSQASSPAN